MIGRVGSGQEERERSTSGDCTCDPRAQNKSWGQGIALCPKALTMHVVGMRAERVSRKKQTVGSFDLRPRLVLRSKSRVSVDRKSGETRTWSG